MTREEFVSQFVSAREEAWLRTNTHHDPFGTSKPRVTEQHLGTWTSMANEAADLHVKQGNEFDAPVAPAHEEHGQ